MYGSNTNALLGHVDRLISYGSTSPLCQPSLPAFSLYVKTSAHWLPTAVCTLIFTLQKSEMGLSFGSAFHMAARSLRPQSQMPLRDPQLRDPQMQVRDPQMPLHDP